MQRDAVHGRRHAVLADAVVDVAAAVVAGEITLRFLVLVLLERRQVGGAERPVPARRR